MKKKKLNSLALNKHKISHLHEQKGGQGDLINVGRTLDACLTDFCAIISVLVCPPPETEFCTVQCQTQNCTFISC